MLFGPAAAEWTSVAVVADGAVSMGETWPPLPFIGLALPRLDRSGVGGVGGWCPGLSHRSTPLLPPGQKRLFVSEKTLHLFCSIHPLIV